MCGIVGYIGDKNKTLNVLLDGLKRLEYRGYDSSGIAIMENGNIKVVKSEGKLENLKKKLDGNNFLGPIGIGHTRWATHGKPSETNAHPHISGGTAVVHNGIIENYEELKEELKQKGFEFYSDTDTEVIPHLIEYYFNNGFDFENAVRNACKRIEGSYACAVVSNRDSYKIIAVRKFAPLILAVSDDDIYFASDVSAILPYTRNVIYLEDGDVAVIEKQNYRITDLNGNEVKRKTTLINTDPMAVEKCGYRHFMLKEINEQSRTILDTIRGRFSLEKGEIYFDSIDKSFLKNINRIVAVGCGTSYHSCLVAKYMIETLARIPVEVDLASEYRYREPIVDSNTLVIAVSQSGETADTSEALIEARRNGSSTLAVTNVINSKISRESDNAIYTFAGPEIGVASTKAFTSQLIAFYFLAIFIARYKKAVNKNRAVELIRDSISLPLKVEKTLKLNDKIKQLAGDFYHSKNFLYLGRGINYPIALEGALKLKEISYIHAEGYAAGEMKHGPIALVDENLPVVVIAPSNGDPAYRKVLGNLQEVRARSGKIILFTCGKVDKDLEKQVDRLIQFPESSYLLNPIISVIPLQLLAYYIANYNGTDIDQPRNLAKVVTVE